MEKLSIKWGRGGSMGPNAIIKIGDKNLGIFYNDADDGVDVDDVWERIIAAFNKEEAA
jgi:hypothetical protein